MWKMVLRNEEVAITVNLVIFTIIIIIIISFVFCCRHWWSPAFHAFYPWNVLLFNNLSRNSTVQGQGLSFGVLLLLLFLEGFLHVWGKIKLKLYNFCFCFDVRISSTNFHQCLGVLLELTRKHFETWLLERTSYSNAKDDLWWRTNVSPRFD